MSMKPDILGAVIKKTTALFQKQETITVEFFQFLLNPIKENLYNFIFKALNFCEDANDVYQETILRAFKYRKSYDRQSPFKTWIFTNEGKSGEVRNKDLQQVLSELQKVLSFKYFRLDGASAITVNDGQDCELRLSSQSPLLLELDDISIKGEKQGERSIAFEFDLKQKAEPFVLKDGNLVYETLIESQTSVKEKGYLVAGVSRIGNGDSLVLVINAEIK